MSSVMIALCLTVSLMSPAARPSGGGGGEQTGNFPLPYFNYAQNPTPFGTDSVSVSALVNHGTDGNETSNLKLLSNENAATATVSNGVFGSIVLLANQMNQAGESTNGFNMWENLWPRSGDRNAESQSFNTLAKFRDGNYKPVVQIVYYGYVYTFNMRFSDNLFHSGMVSGPTFSYNP